MRASSRTPSAVAFAVLLASVLTVVPATPAAAGPPPIGVITTVGGGGTGDGNPAIGTRLNAPIDVDVDTAGNIYIAEDARVRRVDAATGLITTVAGTGEPGFAGDGGPATSALLGQSLHISIDPANDDLYIADGSNCRVRKVDAPTGIITTVAGTGESGFSGDGGPAVDATLCPMDIDVQHDDHWYFLYVADRYNGRIRIVFLDESDGRILTVAGNGGSGQTGDGGSATAAEIGEPWGVAVAPDRDIYIGTAYGHRVRKVDIHSGTISTVLDVGASGAPGGIAFDASGNAFVSDFLDHVIYRIDSGGATAIYAGTPDIPGDSGDGGLADEARLGGPRNVATDAAGNVYIVSIYSRRVRKVTAATGIISTVAGGGVDDGRPAVSTAFNDPDDIAVDAAGNTYLSDARDHRIRRIDAVSGIITTIAGTGISGPAPDGTPAVSAMLSTPEAIAIGPAGDLFVYERWGHRIRRIDAATGLLSTVAGNGTAGFSGDGGPATEAQINGVEDMVFDAAGNLYLADTNNNRIRKVTPGGTITTIAGTGSTGHTGDDGPATAAGIGYPVAIAVDDAGRLYLNGDDSYRIRMVDTSGIISTIAGTGVLGNSGDGGPATAATIGRISALEIEPAGSLVLADTEYHRLRRIDPDGIIDTIAGTGVAADSGDGGPATAASISYPLALDVPTSGDLYLVNLERIRRIDYVLCAGHWVTQMGDGGPNLLTGTGGRDVIHGGAGNDEIRAFGGNDVVCGGDGDDLLLGGPGDDLLDGGDGKDKLRGAAGDDDLRGGEGSDRLLPETGNDLVDGGPGSDIVDYLAGDGPVDADLSAGIASYRPPGEVWTHTLRRIEKIDGTVFADTLVGDARRNVLRGKQGIDQIRGLDGDDDLIGGTGDDTLWGGDGDDLVKGQADDDILRGDAGADRLVGGNGDDALLGGPGDDTLIGGLRVHQGVFSNTIDGGPGNDICRWPFDNPINCDP
jgi:Ca2+-binding RTX toxin-like protein